MLRPHAEHHLAVRGLARERLGKRQRRGFAVAKRNRDRRTALERHEFAGYEIHRWRTHEAGDEHVGLTLPYTVRLRNARQINYPGTAQAYSYESDLIITDKRDGKEVEKTISMNNVHETWDGYRFYLANISPGTETAIQHVQIAVNHDPAKYFATYPGAAISSLGILLLFWMRPYGRKYY